MTDLVRFEPNNIDGALEKQLESVYEQMLLQPCHTKEELNQWIKTFLGISLPDATLDTDNSNSSPLGFIWDVYEAALTGNTEKTSFVVAASRNSTKCLKEGTLVATPRGPVEIQELKTGDTVYDEYGKPVKVTAVHDQGIQDCVDLVHSRSVIATCTRNHKWSTFDVRRPESIVDKKVENFHASTRIKRNTLDLPLGDKREPLAYVLGAFLGDGCSTEWGLRISSQNDLIPTKVANILGTSWSKMKGNFTYIIKSQRPGVRWNFSDFYEKCIRNRKAHEKIVDMEELKKWDRLSLLEFVAGLLDTDGSVYTTAVTGFQVHINFGVQSKDMVDAFIYACQALWQFTPNLKISKQTHYVNGPLYYVKINHAYYCKRMLKELDPHLVTPSKKYKEEYDSIAPNNFSERGYGVRIRDAGRHPCWDITVDSPTSLYTLYNGAVTHNTLGVSILEFMLMLHFGRDIIHMAAILDQSDAAVNYLNNFLRIPAVKRFASTDNRRMKVLKGLPKTEDRPTTSCRMRVIVASKESANAQRASVLCVPGHTKIVTEDGDITAKELHEAIVNNEEVNVLTVDESSGNFQHQRVFATYSRKETKRIKLFLTSGDTLEVTPEHPVAVCANSGPFTWIKAGSLEKGMLLWRVEGKSLLTDTISRIKKYHDFEDQVVYDFSVMTNHNFFANGIMVHNCFDELDLIEEKVLSESAMIGDPDRNGKPPIFIYLSSRKSASGPIQKKIDQSTNPKNGIALHKWNLTDMMRKCPDEVHRPDLPGIPLFIEREALDVKTQEQIDQLPLEKKEGYDKYDAYAGCLECPAFLACKAKSPGQYSQESSILRDIPFVRTVLRETGDPEQIKAQVLNLKPESSGVIYNRFSRNLHYRPLNEVYRFAFGAYPDKGKWVTREDFVRELKENGWRITCGVDFGYTDPATAVIIAYSRSQDKEIIIDCDTATGYSNPDWLGHVRNTLFVKYGFDLLCPDTADKSSPGVASKLGMPSRSKKPLRVETGVSWIRDHLWNVSRQETRFMIVEHKSNEEFVLSMEQWQYKRSVMGFQYGHFEDDTWPTHFQDAHRYGIDPYVMVGAASYSVSSEISRAGAVRDEDEAKEILSTVEETLSSPNRFYQAMSDEYYQQSRIRVDFSKEHVKTKGTNETGNFFFSFEQ
jgi:hypothetical protein